MSKLISQSLFHLMAAVLAVAVFFITLQFADLYHGKNGVENIRERPRLSKSLFLANLNPNNAEVRAANFSKFQAAAKNNYLLLFGSSELTNSNHQFIPYKFFPKQFDVPVFAYGHAYFELLGTLGLLSAIEKELSENSKVVIIISPGWFEHDNLLTQSFVEHFPDDVLAKAVRNSAVKKVFRHYLLRKQNDLSTLTPMQAAILKAGDWGVLKERLNTRLFAYRQRLLGRPFIDAAVERHFVSRHGTSSPNLQAMKTYDWQAAQEKAKQLEFKRPMSEKTGWVYKKYFDKYLESTVSNANRKITYSQPEYELLALESLAEFLHKKGIRALFVMQGLNPLYYKDMHEFDPINKKVAAVLSKYNQHYLDLYFKEVKPAVLTDIMHTGELGWVMMNEDIVRIFYTKDE